MPILPSSYTNVPLFYLNGHFETIIPSIWRKIEGVSYEREKIDTPDGDFLNLDWSRVEGERLLIVSKSPPVKERSCHKPNLTQAPPR